MKGFLTRTIPRRILAALLGIYVTTYLATAIVVYSGVRESILTSDAAALDQLADLKYTQLANVIGALVTDLTAWSKLDVMNDLVSSDIDKRVAGTLEELKKLYGLTGDIYAFDASGMLIASSRNGRTARRQVHIPPEWQSHDKHLVLVDKETDPMSGDAIVALEIPVFGRFDGNYRIGTLVMTYPWASIERQLFSLDSGTVLLERGARTRVLAANPAGIVERAGVDFIRGGTGGDRDAFVIGRSAARSGLIADWQVVTLHDSDIVTRSLYRVSLELALLGAFLGVPIVFLGRWLARKLTAPIADLTRVVSEIADTDRLDARAPVPASEELGTLARSFNRMTDNLDVAIREREKVLRDLASLNLTLEEKIAARTEELEAAMKAQQRLIGDISHEIKSPLARLSMALGLARRSDDTDRPRQFDRIEKEVDAISALASELLAFARLEGAAVPPEFAGVDLSALIGRIVDDAVFETPQRASDVVFRKPDAPVTVVGNADLLRRAIENLVRNAIFYTSENTRIAIALACMAPDRVSITVSDNGPGVPQEALAHLFEPFYRVDEARARDTGGTGIGLAVCQRVVQLHNGTIHAHHNEPHGLIVEIVLPVRPSAS